MTRTRTTLAVLALVGALGLISYESQSARAQEHGGHDEHANAWKSVTKAICVITPTAGNEAHGVVRFSQEGDVVKVVADVSGLSPGQRHGFHIHEWGDTSAPDGKAAGGHYNPEGHAHAGPGVATRHAGDLGNLSADAGGQAHLELELTGVTVAGLRNPIVGRGVIVHAGEDDLKSQPTGGAGARIGQGVIGIAQP